RLGQGQKHCAVLVQRGRTGGRVAELGGELRGPAQGGGQHGVLGGGREPPGGLDRRRDPRVPRRGSGQVIGGGGHDHVGAERAVQGAQPVGQLGRVGEELPGGQRLDLGGLGQD